MAYGSDAVLLLRAVADPGAPAWLRELPAVEVLRRVLVQNYVITLDAAGREVIRAREADTDGLPPGRARLSSPYDTDARWAAKGDELYWNGYKIHVTETCGTPDTAPAGDDTAGDDAAGDDAGGDDAGGERPDIIVGVATTDATGPDARMTEKIHAALRRAGPAARRALPRLGLPLRGAGHRQPAPLGDHAAHPVAGRSVPPGQGRCRV